MSSLDSFYLKQEEPNQGCLLVLRKIILDQEESITEELKWGVPTFSFRNKNFCFLSIEKKTNTPYILFKQGKHLSFPELEARDRKLMKSLHINPIEDIDVERLVLIIKTCLDLYRNDFK